MVKGIGLCGLVVIGLTALVGCEKSQPEVPEAPATPQMEAPAQKEAPPAPTEAAPQAGGEAEQAPGEAQPAPTEH